MLDKKHLEYWAEYKYTSKEVHRLTVGTLLSISAICIALLGWIVIAIFNIGLWIISAEEGSIYQILANITHFFTYGAVGLPIATIIYWIGFGRSRNELYQKVRTQELQDFLNLHPRKAMLELFGVISTIIMNRYAHVEIHHFIELVRYCLIRKPTLRRYIINSFTEDHSKWGIFGIPDNHPGSKTLSTLLKELLPDELKNMVHIKTPIEIRDFIVNSTNKGRWPVMANIQEELDCSDF